MPTIILNPAEVLSINGKNAANKVNNSIYSKPIFRNYIFLLGKPFIINNLPLLNSTNNYSGCWGINMRKLESVIVSLFVMIISLPAVFAVSVGGGVGIDIITEDYAPNVWMCDSRLVLDDATEPGRISLDGYELVERTQNYAFEGEQIQWKVLVMDKNGAQKVADVYGTVGDVQGEGNPIEVNCVEDNGHYDGERIYDVCNARILEERLGIFDRDTMRYYDCMLTIETPMSMYGEYWITIEAIDLDGLVATMDENEYWFLNPIVALSVDGSIEFENVRPGTHSYSRSLLVGNDADDGSGVQLDMFISGTDFYDSGSSGAACPNSNTLRLGDGESDCDGNDAFCYFASHGGYGTNKDLRKDNEGYVGINYGIGFNDPSPFYGNFNGDKDGYEIVQGPQVGPYFPGNVLTPGSEIALTFRLNLPEPCNGDFDSGSLFFWGEAI